MATNAALRYNGTKVNTASPAELTLMLYEGCIKFCNIALLGFEQNDYEKVNNSDTNSYLSLKQNQYLFCPRCRVCNRKKKHK